MNDNNTLFHFLLYKFVPNVNTYEHFLISRRQFVFDPEINLSKDFINCFFVDSFLYDKKFTCLNNFFENKFIIQEKKDDLLHCFCTTQKYYYKFKRLYQRYKIKKAKKYDVDYDLCLTPLENSKNNVIIIQENTKYLFKINDLIRLILDGLTYTYDLFLEPKVAKNPYNNLEFTNCDLYNIYIHMLLDTNINPPLLFHNYFKSEFSLSNFVMINEAYLKDLAIIKHHKELDQDNDKAYEYIMDMAEKSSSLNISTSYPVDDVISKLKFCLLDYLFSEYSYNPAKRRTHKKILLKKLRDFNNSNPRYGRTYRRISRQWANSLETRRNTILNEDRNNFFREATEQDEDVNSEIINEPEPFREIEPTLSRQDTAIDSVTRREIDQLINESFQSTTDRLLTEEIPEIIESDNEILDSDDEFVDRENNIIVNRNGITWTNNIIDESNNEILTRTYTVSYRRESMADTDNLVSTSTFIDNYSFNNPIPNLSLSTIDNITSTENINVSPDSSLEINEISNQPYDASIGPFSPASSQSSISPSVRNLNISSDNVFNFRNNQR